jgi:cytochrome P450
MSSYSHTTVWAAVLGLAALAVYAFKQITLYISRRNFMLENGCEPITHVKRNIDPIFGLDNIYQIIQAAREGRLLDKMKSNYVLYGTTFRASRLGNNVISTIEPQNVKALLSTRFKDFGIGNRQISFGPLLGQGIFTMDGAFWSHSRAMIRPNFARDQVADLGAFEKHIQSLWKLIPRDGSTLDLQELFFRFTIDSATEFLFGQSTNTLKENRQGGPDGAQFAKAFNEAQDAIAMRFRLGFLRHFRRDPKGDEATRICHEFVGTFVDRALSYRSDVEKKGESEEANYVFLHELAKDTKDKKRLGDELMNVLLAGRDTTASLLSNMFFMLAQRPGIYAKLRREVEETLHGELPTYEQLRNMKYLKYCLNECKQHPFDSSFLF